MTAPIDASSGAPQPWSRERCRWLAGLDAGVCGALWVLLWLALHGKLSASLWWSKFNVAASPFFGDRVFSAGPGHVTLVGAALLFVVYSILGALLGRFTPVPPRWPRSFSVGFAGAMVFHLLTQRWGWSLLHPFALSWFTPQAMLPANLLFGFSMGRLGRRYLALMTTFGPLSLAPPVVPAPPDPESTPTESAPTESTPPESAPPESTPIVECPPDPLK